MPRHAAAAWILILQQKLYCFGSQLFLTSWIIFKGKERRGGGWRGKGRDLGLFMQKYIFVFVIVNINTQRTYSFTLWWNRHRELLSTKPVDFTARSVVLPLEGRGFESRPKCPRTALLLSCQQTIYRSITPGSKTVNTRTTFSYWGNTKLRTYIILF